MPQGTYGNVITGINTGLAVYGALGGGQQGGAHSAGCRAPSGCFQCKITGSGDITVCLDTGIAQYNAAMSQAPDVATQIQIVTAFLGAVSNAQLFAQSNAYVSNTVSQLKAKLVQLQGGNAITTVMTNANGQTVQVPSGNIALPSLSSIPPSYLLIGGVAVLGLVYIMKKK